MEENKLHRIEKIGGGVEVVISERHTFGTDSFLLADFAAPRRLDTVCDLGSGCGIIPLLWLREPDAPATVWAVDIQEDAVEQMQQSARRSNLTERLQPLRADLRELRGRLPLGRFDLVTCNPPYNAAGTGIPSSQRSDLVARHETLCTIDDVCAAAEGLLRFGGRLCLCQLPERLVDVLSAMRAHRIEPKRLRMVQQRAASAPWLLLIEGKRGAKPHLQMDVPLIMREHDGPSAEMQRIYRYYGKV